MAATTPIVRQQLIAALYAELNGKTVDMPAIVRAVDRALETTGYDQLADAFQAADQAAQFYSKNVTGAPADPNNYAGRWVDERGALSGVNSGLHYNIP